MRMKNLIPWRRNRGALTRSGEVGPFYTPQGDLNRLFDDLFTVFDRQWDFGLIPTHFGRGLSAGTISPRIDVAEDSKAITLTAELPGMDEKDVELLLTDDVLTIKGEKKSESEKKDKDYYRMERSYGSFYRSFPLPEGVDADKVEASFKKGVLTVTLPKLPEAVKEARKITVKKG
jgi:HSP20 family protein